jgi:anti-anti-sigma factor
VARRPTSGLCYLAPYVPVVPFPVVSVSAGVTRPATAPQSLLRIHTHSVAARSTVFLDGDLDLRSAPRLARTVRRLLRDFPREVIVDVRCVRLCSPQGVASLLGLHGRLEQAGVQMALRGPNPRLGLLFELYGLKEILVLPGQSVDGSVHRAGAPAWPTTGFPGSGPTATVM